MLSSEALLILAAIMFLIGVCGVIVRKNLIVVFMCLELMMNAANVTFLAAEKLHPSMDAQILVLVVMTVAAAEAAVGLAIVLAIFRTKRSIETQDVDDLSG